MVMPPIVVNASDNTSPATPGYTAASNTHAGRPKLVGIGDDRYLVLWEEWSSVGGRDSFKGVYGMLIDAYGNTLKPAKLLTPTCDEVASMVATNLSICCC